jgi:hypothetical protein
MQGGVRAGVRGEARDAGDSSLSSTWYVVCGMWYVVCCGFRAFAVFIFILCSSVVWLKKRKFKNLLIRDILSSLADRRPPQLSFWGRKRKPENNINVYSIE